MRPVRAPWSCCGVANIAPISRLPSWSRISSARGDLTGVAWDSPAFNAGLTIGTKLIALNGRAFDADQFKAVLKAKKTPLSLLVKTGDIFRTVELTYDGGLRYPRLERIPGSTATSLDALLTAKP